MRYRRFSYHYRALHTHELAPPAPRVAIAPTHWRPFLDLVEGGQGMTLTAELAGVDEDDLDILLYENALVVEGVRRHASHRETVFHVAEIRYGSFRLEVEIPNAVDRDSVRAVYDRGMLRVELPYREGRRDV